MRKLISHKYLKPSFFRNEGFVFPGWLSRQGLKKFVEMGDPWYPELVRVFYSNLKISDGTLCSTMKGVDIKLTDEVWTNIGCFRLGGEKCHLSGMKKDDRLCVFVISWILMPRGSNHAQATTEDLCLLKVIKENVQVDWPAAISENMLKVTRLESAMLPYCVFISRVLIHFGVECVNESNESYGRSNMIEKSALHHMGLHHGLNAWLFKDEYADEEEEATRSSSIPYRPRSEFEKFIVREMRPLKNLCQETRQDVLKIMGHLNLNDSDEGAVAEEGSKRVKKKTMKKRRMKMTVLLRKVLVTCISTTLRK
ncbi:hypothetical protein LR48_Vigan08g018700 [Vigna angularis]|uniref:Uncharacterized protein n=1 Tax=Phaseolus angularis TaxID=3914 RepID=A0A0L9V2M7_PHAAN|nr:hypothetical protein LR48_Vigan08g018700 [Vigna angularis]